MNVFFEDKEVVYIRHSIHDIIPMGKQYVANYLTGKFDKGTVYDRSPINERQLMLSYLPFIHEVVINDYSNARKLEENEIKLVFRPMGMLPTSPMTLTVSKEMHDFFAQK